MTRPRGQMREQILDVALELFNEQGYDKTSLREIAERLGVTKAALYYHFRSKSDILLELHLRMHELGRGALAAIDELGDDEDAIAAWPALIDGFIDEVLANRDLFLLHQRNQNAFREIMDNERHQAENEDMEERLRRFLATPAIPLEQRVRIACSIGAVLMPLMGADELFGEASATEVGTIVREVARDLIGARRAQA
ncbi:MAG TPA: helix-turn-helix domain-containing protein [Gaiellaceae bacterium]|nr:helix-turn-helix domain-containing protein [Gaiellaceae bacterium]